MESNSVGLLELALEPNAYATLLASADLLLLPYDATAYGPRSSNILAEALALDCQTASNNFHPTAPKTFQFSCSFSVVFSSA